MNLLQDLRHALRIIGKSPGFTLIAVLSLALGIGANTAVFTVIRAVLLRPLPYPDPAQLVYLQENSNGAVSVPELLYWKQHTSGFASSAGYRGGGDRFLALNGHQEWIRTMTVTADFFRTLGIVPALGREFDGRETVAGGAQAVVLSDALWRRCGGDSSILGQTLRLDEGSFTVVGVAPAGFWFPQRADAFVPLQPSRKSLTDSGTNTSMIARMKPGITLSRLQAEMPAVTEGMRREFGMSKDYRGLNATSYQDFLVGDVRLNLLLVFGAVALLLLIACSNLASLLLARLASRQREIAVRMAMGSSRGRLLSQFLTENLLLTTLGGAAGFLAARASLQVMLAAIPFALPSSTPIRIDAPVLLFTLGIAFATGAIFSLAPMISSRRLDLQEMLKAGGRSTTGGPRQRARSALIVSEVALSVTLLVSAGLLFQTLYRLRQENLGFQPGGLVTFSTPIAPARAHSEAAFQHIEAEMLERLQSVPGVTRVAAANVLPLAGYGNLPTQREGHVENSIGGMEVRAVTPAYFETMGITVRKGRAFGAEDTASSAPVVIVNETVARRWWRSAEPLADRVVIGRYKGRDLLKPVARNVVGVVADTKTMSLAAPAQPTVYVPAAQNTYSTNSIAWVLRAQLTPGLAAEIRRAIASIDPAQRIGNMRTMEEIVDATTARSRFDAWLFGFLAALAVLLTAIGLYGVLSFAVARRTNEIGTRMALGATRGDVMTMILRQGLALIGIGLAIGLAGAYAATRALTTLLFGVKPTDPYTFVAVAALLIAVGVAASYIPARRATKVDPMVALRYE
ncbi:MAG TPA: ABC transporter permease [Candidatus Solibacter sp.]|nr:ABC transporter permease [Candidatus Solibacter sp.]